MTEYCDCPKAENSYTSLNDPLNTFVHYPCGRPSYLVWLASEKFCQECGCSIYTRWELFCSPCRTALVAWAMTLPDDDRREVLTQANLTEGNLAPWTGWPEAREKARNHPFGSLKVNRGIGCGYREDMPLPRRLTW